MRKCKIIALLFFTLLLVSILKAQPSITGKTVDQRNNPIPFASVVLLQNDKIIAGTTSNANGLFTVSYNFSVNKIFTLKVSSTGYRMMKQNFIYPDTGFIKSITLINDENALTNITVTANKPLLTQKADRTIINIENSFLANGNNGLEVLQKTPGIWLDNNGSMHIKGNAPVTVMVNDVIQRMSEEDLQEYLRTLKSEEISRIEIISNPPAEFEAQGSGGIIHIILKKSRKDGLNGSVNSQYRQQITKPYWASGVLFDYKIKKIYLSANYSVNRDIKTLKEASELLFDTSRFFNNYTARTDDYFRQQYRFAITYDFSDKQTISLQTNTNANSFNQALSTSISNQENNKTITGNSTATRQRHVIFNSNTFNYMYKIDTAGSFFKIIGDYSTNKKTETSKFYNFYIDSADNSIYRNTVPNSMEILNVQADYTKTIHIKTTLNIGLKYVAIKRDNEVLKEDSINATWIKNLAASDHFIYNENLWMTYATIEKRLKHTNIKLGLRAEETESKGNSITNNTRFTKYYIGFFPSFYFTQTLNETKGNLLYFNYSRRITRPSLSDLNPNRLQFTSNTATIGNPNLLPQFSHNIELGATLLNRFSGNIYFTRTTDIITLSASSDSNNFINYTSVNLNGSNEYGINMNISFKLSKAWAVNNSIETNNISYTLNERAIHQVTVSLRSSNTISIKHLFDIDATTSYRSATQYANILSPALFYLDIGFTKKILKKKGALRLDGADILNTISEKEYTTTPDLYIYFYRKRPSRTVSLSFNYNFSFGKKFTEKKVEQSGNDLRNRIGN